MVTQNHCSGYLCKSIEKVIQKVTQSNKSNQLQKNLQSVIFVTSALVAPLWLFWRKSAFFTHDTEVVRCGPGSLPSGLIPGGADGSVLPLPHCPSCGSILQRAHLPHGQVQQVGVQGTSCLRSARSTDDNAARLRQQERRSATPKLKVLEDCLGPGLPETLSGFMHWECRQPRSRTARRPDD